MVGVAAASEEAASSAELSSIRHLVASEYVGLEVQRPFSTYILDGRK